MSFLISWRLIRKYFRKYGVTSQIGVAPFLLLSCDFNVDVGLVMINQKDNDSFKKIIVVKHTPAFINHTIDRPFLKH